MKSTMVDSTPIVHGPPSMIKSTSLPRSSNTCCAVVGLTFPNLFAEGAASGTCVASINRRVKSFAGTRNTAVSRLPVTANKSLSDFFNKMLRGPGQHALATVAASSEISIAQSFSCSNDERCAINGCVVGRPLTEKILFNEIGLFTAAANP